MSFSGWVRDAFGNIDDFRAPAGEVGLPLTRKLMMKTEITRLCGEYLKTLAVNRFRKDEVEEMMLYVLEEIYEEVTNDSEQGPPGG